MKRITRLTESDLHRIVKESVKRILSESNEGRIEKVYTGENGAKYHVSIDKPSRIKSGQLYCGFEYWVEEWEEDSYIEGGIWIEDGYVVDFDGCGVLPKAVKKALAEMGIQTD